MVKWRLIEQKVYQVNHRSKESPSVMIDAVNLELFFLKRIKMPRRINDGAAKITMY